MAACGEKERERKEERERDREREREGKMTKMKGVSPVFCCYLKPSPTNYLLGGIRYLIFSSSSSFSSSSAFLFSQTNFEFSFVPA